MNTHDADYEWKGILFDSGDLRWLAGTIGVSGNPSDSAKQMEQLRGPWIIIIWAS